MISKSIEIYYDIGAIPGFARCGLEAARDFRDAAMSLIGQALDDYGAGKWEGAEIGRRSVHFGFAVGDFDHAETIVREAVAGTPYDDIRAIERNEFEEVDYL